MFLLKTKFLSVNGMLYISHLIYVFVGLLFFKGIHQHQLDPILLVKRNKGFVMPRRYLKKHLKRRWKMQDLEGSQLIVSVATDFGLRFKRFYMEDLVKC